MEYSTGNIKLLLNFLNLNLTYLIIASNNMRSCRWFSHETLVALSKTFSPEGPPMPHRYSQTVLFSLWSVDISFLLNDTINISTSLKLAVTHLTEDISTDYHSAEKVISRVTCADENGLITGASFIYQN
ncbi:hypothetical protein X798_03937 [Onchocerca flexuosa]|uniref:Uncharacterized protein n=1 Tax=Onchocerca flexuosa TaxID=387005 RepID=A0A238BUJ6_9BILA|nr:hypothetical protein X798_03937 [Onchocerca flexuosa]